jgi:hypothetical protein
VFLSDASADFDALVAWLHGLNADALLEVMTTAERVAARAHALQLCAVERFAQLRPSAQPERVVSEFAVDEIAPELRLSRAAAQNKLALAHDLTHRLPGALGALHRGEIDLRKAQAIANYTSPLDQERAAAVQDTVLPRAGQQTLGQLQAALRRAIQRIDPEGAAERHRSCRRERCVQIMPQPEGMASLWAFLPAEDAVAIYHKVDHLARTAKTPRDERSADERRADVFTDLLLNTHRNPTGSHQGANTDRHSPTHTDTDAQNGMKPAAHNTSVDNSDTAAGCGSEAMRSGRIEVLVTIPATTLLGLDNGPAELDGYGAITAETARQLAHRPNAIWRRILTDPVDGALLDYGRRTYHPPAALHDHVTVRDGTCRFPGCQHPARRADLDHTVPYPHGPTADHNLGALCRHHHRLKTHSRWRLTQHHGTFVWTSPTGRTYTRTPEPLAEPAPTPPAPPQTADDDPPPF